MLIQELLQKREPRLHYNRVGTYGGFEVLDTRHEIQRAEERGIPRAFVITVLKRIGYAKRAIAQDGETEGVRLYDSVNNLEVVVQKLPREDRNVLLILTVYKPKTNKPQGRSPRVTVR
jgi:hypothetical protein